MKRLLCLCLASALTLSLAACGGTPAPSSSPSGGTAESSAPTEIKYDQGATEKKIVVANSAATSGAYAPVGVPFNAGIQAYFDMVNAAGGIDGRTIEFKHVDDEFDPLKGKAALQSFVEDEGVFAIVGHFGTPVVGATIGDLKDYGIPAVYFATGIGQLYAEGATSNAEGYNIFPVQPIYVTEGRIMVARGLSNFNATKIGVIYTNDDAGKDMLKGAQSQCDESGIPYVAEQVAAGASDVSAAVTSLKTADVDFIICAAIQATMPTIVKELAAQGMTAPVITTYVNVSSAIPPLVGDSIKGKFDVYGNGWVSYEDFRADELATYQEWANKLDESYANNAYAQTGWIAAHFFCEGLRRIEGQDITWANYMAALESAPIQNPFGGLIDYSGGNRAGTQEMNLSKINLDAPDGSGWELVYGLESMDSLLAGK